MTTSTEERIELTLGGMTCAACAARIERALNRIDGVGASVNYATERATVHVRGAVAPDALVAAVEGAGYQATLATAARDAAPDDARLRMLRRRLVVSAVLGVPVLALSMIDALQFDGWQWVALALATPVATWGAWPFHRAMLANLRHGQATMDTLVSVGVLAAYGWSLWALVATDAGDIGGDMAMAGGDTPYLYLEVASTVVALILAGRYLEARAKRRAGAALRALLDLGAKDVAVVQTDGTEQRVPVEQLVVGDRFVVRPGEKVATDGVVDDGVSAIDTSLVTGESVPREVGPGDPVVGATVNAGGRLVVRATRVGADTQLAQMARLVEQAQSGKARVQRLADRISGVFVPIVIAIALATLAGWLLATGDTSRSVSAAIAVLIIACPCALGLATPTALLVGTGRGAQLGVLIKGPEVLEDTRAVDTIVLDKTGTVTTGAMALVDVRPAPGVDADELLALAGAVEAASEHPIGRAVAAAAAGAGPLPPVTAFHAAAGLGVSGRVGGRVVEVGRADDASNEAAGHTVVAVTVDGTPWGELVVADTVKPTSRSAVSRLRRMGLRPVLVTGDNLATARAVGAEVGIAADDVQAGVLPAGKVDAVAALQAAGRTVAMVGDGVNDAAALAQADLGIAMATGTDAAIEASDLTLVRDDLHAAADAIELSRRTLRTIKGNLFWAFAYNVAAIPLAVAGLLSPLVAGAAMACSSLFVVGNSLRLRRFRPGHS